MSEDNNNFDSMAHPFRQFLEDPEYWQRRADEARTQASYLYDQPIFARALERHASDFDRMAQQAFKLRQTKQRIARIGPEFRNPGTVVALKKSSGAD